MRRHGYWFWALVATPALVGRAPVLGAEDVPITIPASYQDCLAAIKINSGDAFERALYWRDHGGGVPAEHCAAMALIAAHQPEEAAARLDALARDPDIATLAERADFMDQSGNAWLVAGRTSEAEQAFSAGLKLAPRNASLWFDRGRTFASTMQWAKAEDNYNHALFFDAGRADVYVARAAARMAQGNKDGARADIDKALAIDPHNPDALVQRGSMRWGAGDKTGARADWLQVLLTASDSPAGDAARTRIEAVEVHIKD